MECPACYTLYIDPALCNGCGKCVSAAPDGAVAYGEGMIHVIKKDLLEMKSSDFAAVCPVGGHQKGRAGQAPIPTDPVPVGSFAAAAGGCRRRRG